LYDIKKNGESIQIDDLQRIPSIAVYLDGYQYHATKESNRFIGDIQKRISIVDTGRYLTWTLTWEDLNYFEAMLI
jgi:DEAD/DEAH box helicase domain-containing protein